MNRELKKELTKYLDRMYDEELSRVSVELDEEQLRQLNASFNELMNEVVPVAMHHLLHNGHGGNPSLDDIPEELVYIFKKNLRKNVHNILNGRTVTRNAPFSLTELVKLRRFRNRKGDPRTKKSNEPRRNGLSLEQRRTRNQLRLSDANIQRANNQRASIPRGSSINNAIRSTTSRRRPPPPRSSRMYEENVQNAQQHNNLFKMLEELGPNEPTPSASQPSVARSSQILRPPPSRRRNPNNRSISLNRAP
jgi:hypothetical protein